MYIRLLRGDNPAFMHRHYSIRRDGQRARVYTSCMAVYDLAPLALTMPLVLWGMFLLAAVVSIVLSAVMVWHWHLYSTGRYTSRFVLLVYLSGVAACLFLMALGVLWDSHG